MAEKKNNLVVAESVNDKKEFLSFKAIHNGKSGTFAIFEALIDDVEEADYKYSETFNRCIRRKIPIPSESKMLKFLDESGEWPEKNEERISELESEISEQRESLLDIRKKETHSKADKKEANVLTSKIRKSREELINIRQERNVYLIHTAEGRADDSKRNYIIFSSLKKIIEYEENGKKKVKLGDRVWDDYEMYRVDKDIMFKSQAFIQYISFISNSDGDLMSLFAEEQSNPWD